MTRFAPILLAFPLLALGLAITASSNAGGHGEKKTTVPTKAVCVVHPLSDSKVSGVVYFTQKGDEVEISGEIKGLSPGLHGFHVHEFGDLTKSDGLATGGHFNPEGKKHGSPKAEDRHVGDLGNVKADKDGVAKIHMMDKLIKLDGPHSILGRGLIVHAKEDDEKTQPTGDAGGRVGGGVVGIAFVAPPKKKD